MQDKHTNVRGAYRPALFPKRGDHNKQGKTYRETPRSKKHIATQK